MTRERKQFRREDAEARRDALIDGTLSLICERGIGAATVRAIAARSGVTPGLIRHYFSSKEDLLGAAFSRHMSTLTETTRRRGRVGTGARDQAAARLAGFVQAALGPPVVGEHALSLWAGFMTLVRRDPGMRDTHARSYREFRGHLEVLIRDAMAEAGQPLSPEELRRKAIACNAVIDGLWLEGGALPSEFGPGELQGIGLASVGAILGLPLLEEGGDVADRASARSGNEGKEPG